MKTEIQIEVGYRISVRKTKQNRTRKFILQKDAGRGKY